MQCCIIQFPVEIRNRGWQGELISATRDVTQDKRGLLVGGEGAPIWLVGVIEKGCEELDKIQNGM